MELPLVLLFLILHQPSYPKNILFLFSLPLLKSFQNAKAVEIKF
jgi:hypothetical protein